MFPDCSLPTEEEISRSYSVKWSDGGIVEGGECLMLNTTAWHSAAEGSSVCSLAEILEPSVAQKFYLSPKACAGILRRAAKRGKELPPMLKAALEAVASAPQSRQAGEGSAGQARAGGKTL